MKQLLFKLLLKFFEKEIKYSFIEEEFKSYKIDKKSLLIAEKLSDLYLYPEYKIFSQILSNRAKNLAVQGMKMKYSNEKEFLTQHSFIRGQVFNIAYTLRWMKFMNKRYQNKGNKKHAGIKKV